MSHIRRSRIVATLGPATDPPGILAALIEAGVDVARINFSHGTADELADRIRRFRQAGEKAGRNVAVLADLPGPKLRVLLPEPRELSPGDALTLAADAGVPGDVAVTEPDVLTAVMPGHRILLDDGRLQLRVVAAMAGRVTTQVVVGGKLLPKKGVNLPDSPLTIPAVTPRDREALDVCARAGVDWLALSFVRGPEAADELRREADRRSIGAPVLAKIERPEAVAKIAEIVAAFDGIMVARGDLGVEIPLAAVPVAQKRLIAAARAAGKPVITATDMLDSMRVNPRPTRAEASDVANAVYDGTDALMLSGETAVGAHPLAAVQAMDSIAREAEADLASKSLAPLGDQPTMDEDLAATACNLADTVGADAIVVPTLSGRTARQVARYRPRAAIVAPVPAVAVRRRLALLWGVQPIPLAEHLAAGADRIDAAVRAAASHGAVATGQRVVVYAGHPVEGGPRLPTLRVVKAGVNGESVEA